MLANKPKHLQDFILQASVLQKFCADSCKAVTGRDDGRALLHINRSEEALNLLETVTDAEGASPVSHSTYHVLRTFSLMMLDRAKETAPMWDDPGILDSAARDDFRQRISTRLRTALTP